MPAALTDQFVMHAHLCGGPGRQIGVFGVRQTLDIPWTYAVRPLPARIGCGFARLIVEIAGRESDAATPMWIGSPNRRGLSLNWPKIKAAVHQPAEIG
jgi:hypothetical protein